MNVDHSKKCLDRSTRMENHCISILLFVVQKCMHPVIFIDLSVNVFIDLIGCGEEWLTSLGLQLLISQKGPYIDKNVSMFFSYTCNSSLIFNCFSIFNP